MLMHVSFCLPPPYALYPERLTPLMMFLKGIFLGTAVKHESHHIENVMRFMKTAGLGKPIGYSSTALLLIDLTWSNKCIIIL